MAKKKKEPKTESEEEGEAGPSGETKQKKRVDLSTFEISDIEPEPKQKQPKKVPGLFLTREIGKHYLDRESYIKLNLREFLIYLIFIIILGVLASHQHNSSEYYLARVMRRLFVDSEFKTDNTKEVLSFKEINTIDQAWEYFDYYVLNMYWDFWYSPKSKIEKAIDEDQTLFYNNRLIGTPRIRQLRVKKDSCEVPVEFKSKMTECYAGYSSGAESTESFGFENSTAWKYAPASETGAQSVSGAVATYGGGGYYYDFEKTREDTKEAVMNVTLAAGKWIDRATRAVILQFTTYNSNENIFFTQTLLLEFPPTGGVVPSYSTQAHKFFMRDIWDVIVLVLFGVFCFFVAVYTVFEIFEIMYFKWNYFNSFWNIVDLIVLIFSYVTIALFVFSFLLIQKEIVDLIKIEDKHACFDSINNAREMFITMLVVTFFFAAIKGVKYLNFNYSMGQMHNTFDRASSDLACFAFIFAVVFISFAQFGSLLFGSQVNDFRTFVHATFALLRTAVGDFDYHKIEHVNHIMGPIYFFMYIFFIYFILVNMFLAIIIDTYSEVRAAARDRTRDAQASDLFARWARKLTGGCFRKKRQEERGAAGGGEGAAYDDIQNLLRRCGFTEMEIDLFFAKFEIPRDRPISQEEMRDKLMTNFHMQPEPEKDKGKGKKAPATTLPTEEMDELGQKLMNRITELEKNISEVNDKIDQIDKKIDNLTARRSRKKT